MAQTKLETMPKAQKVQVQQAAPTLREGKAVSAVRAMRNRLADESPAFKAAINAEAEAESFCREIRDDLRRQREAQKIEQGVLGKRLDMGQSAVSKIETGEGDIGVKTIFRHARALGLRPVCFFVPTIAIGKASGTTDVAQIQEIAERQTVAAVEAIQKAEVGLIRKSVSDAVSNALAELKGEA
jgi:transcriptional regulator with XRE-family HTH domain